MVNKRFTAFILLGALLLSILSPFSSFAATVNVTLKAVDTSGNPLEGVRFWVNNGSWSYASEYFTDSTGTVSFQLDDTDTYYVDQYVYPGFGKTDTQTITPTEGAFYTFTNQPLQNVTLRSVDSATGNGISNVTFDIVDLNTNLLESVMTDSNGDAIAALDPSKSYTITQRVVYGYQKPASQKISAPFDSIYTFNNVPGSGSITVSLKDVNGYVIPGVPVEIALKSDNMTIATITTNDQGIANFANLDTDLYVVRIARQNPPVYSYTPLSRNEYQYDAWDLYVSQTNSWNTHLDLVRSDFPTSKEITIQIVKGFLLNYNPYAIEGIGVYAVEGFGPDAPKTLIGYTDANGQVKYTLDLTSQFKPQFTNDKIDGFYVIDSNYIPNSENPTKVIINNIPEEQYIADSITVKTVDKTTGQPVPQVQVRPYYKLSADELLYRMPPEMKLINGEYYAPSSFHPFITDGSGTFTSIGYTYDPFVFAPEGSIRGTIDTVVFFAEGSPFGYITTDQTFTIDPTTKEVIIPLDRSTSVDYVPNDVVLRKTDNNGNPLVGAVFNYYYKKDPIEVLPPTAEVIQVGGVEYVKGNSFPIYTGADGTFTFTGYTFDPASPPPYSALRGNLGEILLQEVQAPFGYALDKTFIPINSNEVTAINQPGTSSNITFKFVDADTLEPITIDPGLLPDFTLFKGPLSNPDFYSTSLLSTTGEVTFENLTNSYEYFYQEPNIQGYTNSQEYKLVDLTKSEIIVPLKKVGTSSRFIIRTSQFTLQNGTPYPLPLAGKTLRLYDANGTLLEEFTYGQDTADYYTKNDYPEGTYTVKLFEGPVQVGERTFTVTQQDFINTAGLPFSVNFLIQPAPIRVQVDKYDSVTKSKLANAEFAIYRYFEMPKGPMMVGPLPTLENQFNYAGKQWTYYKTVKTNADGQFDPELQLDRLGMELVGSPAYEYLMVEIKAPDGYANNFEPVLISKTEDLQTFSIPNDPTFIDVEKKWVDGDNVNNTRPASIDVGLYNDTTLVQSATLDATNNWSHRFTGLNYYDANGVLINYTVKEINPLTNYVTTYAQEAGNPHKTIITNTLTKDIHAIKEWGEGSTEVPVTFELQKTVNGITTTETKTLDSTNGFTTVWEKQPVFDELGNEITYTVVEKDPPVDFIVSETTGTGIETDPFNITNTPKPKLRDVIAEKKWSLGSTPQAVTFELTQTLNGTTTTMGQLEANDSNGYRVAWENVLAEDVYGNVATYSITEVNPPAGFKASAVTGNGTVDSPFAITNTEVKDVYAKKSWSADATPAPVDLTLNQVINNVLTPVGTKTVNDANSWTVSWAEQPVYDASGNEIQYIVTENVPDGYSMKYDGGTGTAAEPYIITNTLNPIPAPKTVDIYTEKRWAAGSTPVAVTLQLAKVTDNGLVVVGEAEYNDQNAYKHTFTNLLLEDELGSVIRYVLIEPNELAGFNSSPAEGSGTEIDPFFITNTPIPVPKIDIHAKKEWAPGSTPQAVTFELSRIDGSTVETLTQMTLDAPNWDATWTDLEQFAPNGSEYTYIVKEIDVPTGFTASVPTGTGTVSDPFIITNTPDSTPVVVETVDIYAEKQWETGSTSVPVILELRKVEGDNLVLVDQAEFNEGNSFKHTFVRVPLKDEYGSDIQYVLVEPNVPTGFTSSALSGSGTQTDPFVIKNTPKPLPPKETVDIHAKKVWEIGSTGEPVTFELTRILGTDLEVLESKTLSSDTEWKASWTGQDKFAPDGREYTYLVREINLPTNYKMTSETGSGTLDDPFIITNGVNETPPKLRDVYAKVIWAPGTTPGPIELELSKIEDGKVVVIGRVTVSSSDNWSTIWRDQPIYDAYGSEIVYLLNGEKIPPYHHKSDTTGVGTETNPLVIEISTLTTPAEVIDIHARKDWEEGLKKVPVTLKLFRIEGRNVVEVERKEVDELVGWNASWYSLPKFDSNGELIRYVVSEVNVPSGMYASVPTGTGALDDPFVIMNRKIIIPPDPVDPVDPTPVDPTDPWTPPVRPTDPTDPVTPPVKPTDPVVPTDPVSPETPTEPTKPIKPPVNGNPAPEKETNNLPKTGVGSDGTLYVAVGFIVLGILFLQRQKKVVLKK
ncbi:Cna B-type domain-containing protein [Guggenheimella bovis]